MEPQKRIKSRVDKPTYFLSKKVGMAIADYQLLEDGDRIIVAVSGGKDSFALLKMLKYRQSFVPIKFDLLAVHVDMGFSNDNARRLEEYCRKEEVPFLVQKEDILKDQGMESLNCFWCSWNRRRVLFEIADQKGYNKVALGHHMDDIIETILLNIFYQGSISAMKPKQEFFKGKLTVIRPLAYVEEKDIERWLEKTKSFPLEDYVCPKSDLSKRLMVKNLIKTLSKENKHVKKNIFESVKRIKLDYLLGDVV